MWQIVNKHWLNAGIQNVPGVALGGWEISLNKGKILALLEMTFYHEEEVISQISTLYGMLGSDKFFGKDMKQSKGVEGLPGGTRDKESTC